MRYFITFLIGIGLVVLIIILLIRAIFGGGGGVPEEERAELTSYANSNVIMRMTIDGPVNSEEIHRQIRIDVSQFSSELRTITGYEGRVDSTARFDSNPTAYANFLRALDLLGYTQGDDKEEVADERGYCPAGRRYVFEILDGSEQIQRYWTTSCDHKLSFKGDADGVINLFRAQIPEYNQRISDSAVPFR